MIDYHSPVSSTSVAAGLPLTLAESVDVPQEVSKLPMAEELVCGSGLVSRGSSVSTLPWVCKCVFCICLTVLDRMIQFMMYPLVLMIPG